MPHRGRQVGVLLAAGALLIATLAIGQSRTEATSTIKSHDFCSGPYEERSSVADVRIDNVTFSGFLQIPISDQQEIVASVKNATYGGWRDGAVEQALEEIKEGWQDRGYFKVEVSSEAKEVTSNVKEVSIALFAHVDEHARYILRAIRFQHAQLSTDFLRSRFPIENGEFFSRARIEKGLENLGKVYGELGYVNYIGVPKTEFDEKKRAISLIIDIDTGRQYIVGSINVLGLNGPAKEALLTDFPLKTGDVYNQRLLELGLSRHSSPLQGCGCRSNVKTITDEQSGTVALTLDFRPCNE